MQICVERFLSQLLRSLFLFIAVSLFAIEHHVLLLFSSMFSFIFSCFFSVQRSRSLGNRESAWPALELVRDFNNQTKVELNKWIVRYFRHFYLRLFPEKIAVIFKLFCSQGFSFHKPKALGPISWGAWTMCEFKDWNGGENCFSADVYTVHPGQKLSAMGLIHHTTFQQYLGSTFQSAV